jgi:glycogen operon protein
MDKQVTQFPDLKRGEPIPLGATLTAKGINFAVFASRATAVDLCVFDSSGEVELWRWPLPGHTAGVWHGLLPAPEGQAGVVYGFRVHGAYEPARGLRHNPHKLLIDPYARALRGSLPGIRDIWLRRRGSADIADVTDSAPYVPKSVVIDAV